MARSEPSRRAKLPRNREGVTPSFGWLDRILSRRSALLLLLLWQWGRPLNLNDAEMEDGMDEYIFFLQNVWPELYRAEGNKNDDTEAWGIERRWHGADFEIWPPTAGDAQAWYYRRVWIELGLATMPRTLAIDCFIFALNTSLIRAGYKDAPIKSPVLARTLQCAIHALGHDIEIDSVLGPKTMRAIQRTPHQEKLSPAFRAAGNMYYSGLAEFPKYKESWLRRNRV